MKTKHDSSATEFPVALGLMFGICGLIGCGQSGEESPSIPSDLSCYATLPLLQHTHHPALRNELSLIVREKGTPALLHANSAMSPLDATSSAVVANEMPEGSLGLSDVYSAETVATITSRLEPIYPTDRFEFSGMAFREAIELRQTFDGLRQRARQALADPEFRFDVQHSLGLSLDTAFVDSAFVAGRLEAIQAAESLHRAAPRGAIEPLTVMFQIAEALGREKHVVPRLAAVEMRAEALQVMKAIVTHERSEKSDLRRLAKLLRNQLEGWPSDRGAWIGDRAQGMHTYEMVRDGFLLSLLSYEEIREYGNEVAIHKLGKIVAENLDRDELFYLKAMRRIIELSEGPFHKRRKFFKTMSNDLEQLRSTAAYPFVADQLLLVNIESGHRMQAVDRARCEAWCLALSLAVDDAVGEAWVNPLTGFPYIIDPRPSLIIVDAIDPDRSAPRVEVPVRL